MLYPKEDKENKILLYACRNCDYKTEADSYCIYVNKIMHEIELVEPFLVFWGIIWAMVLRFTKKSLKKMEIVKQMLKWENISYQRLIGSF